MNYKANMIINRNIYWKVRELMNSQFSDWTYGTDYDIMSAYPSSAGAIVAYPAFTIATDAVRTKPYQIGSRDRVMFSTEIVIFSENIAQRDYMNFFLYESFQNRDHTLYDLSSSDPVGAGDYSGLGTLGKYRCYGGAYYNIPVPIHASDNQTRYESDITLEIECPNF